MTEQAQLYLEIWPPYIYGRMVNFGGVMACCKYGKNTV